MLEAGFLARACSFGEAAGFFALVFTVCALALAAAGLCLVVAAAALGVFLGAIGDAVAFFALAGA